MKNEAMKTLIQDNKHAMQDLHTVFGFDFCAEFDAWKIDGAYTVRKIEREAEKRGYTTGNSVIAVCTRSERIRNRWYHLVTVEPGGGVCIEHKTPYHSDGQRLDYFFTKTDFNDNRKAADAETVVIVQKRDNLKRPTPRKINPFGRYKLLNFTFYHTNGKRYVDEIKLQELDGSKATLTYEIIGQWFNGSKKYPETIEQVIDSAGYLLNARRDDLKSRAAALKAEREKAAYNATDNASKIAELSGLIAERKRAIVKALEDANTAEELFAVYDSLSNWKGLLHVVSNFECLVRDDSNKEFKSVEQFTRAYNEIRTALQ